MISDDLVKILRDADKEKIPAEQVEDNELEELLICKKNNPTTPQTTLGLNHTANARQEQPALDARKGKPLKNELTKTHAILNIVCVIIYSYYICYMFWYMRF